MFDKDELEKKELPELYKLLERKTAEKYKPGERIVENIRVKLNLLRLVVKVYREIDKTSKNNISQLHDKFTELEEWFTDSTNANLTTDINKDLVELRGIGDLQIHDKFAEMEEWFLNKIGVDLQVSISEELEEMKENGDLDKKGLLVYTNHHGGGAETYCSRFILDRLKNAPARWAVKDSLTNLLLYGDIILKSKPIVIERRKEGDQSSYKAKLMKYGIQIANALKNKETVVIAFEGTRSKDGEIVDDSKYKKIAETLDFFTRLAIKKGGDEFKGMEYNKALMTVDTFTALPKAWEKDFFAKTGMKAGMRAHLELLPEDISLKAPEYPEPVLSISEERLDRIEPTNHRKIIETLLQNIKEREIKIKEIREDTSNIFGYARKELRSMLIKELVA